MAHLLLEEIVGAAGGKTLYGNQREFSGLSIDSRTIRPGELFVALRGARFDGHDFLSGALKTGAGAIVDHPPAELFADKTIILVKDTLVALQDIARRLRRSKDVTVVGVTGTNGKTTTKELIASVLGRRHSVLKTEGNLNNHIGLPLSICRMSGDEAIMVLEMGSNAEGDITHLCDIARPDFAVVTNVGPAHLEGFGSIESVRKTDLEILGYVRAASVNADDAFLLAGVDGYRGKIITYGMERRADVYAEDIAFGQRGSRFVIRFPDGGTLPVCLQIAGRFNIYNALAAASLADELDTDRKDIKEGLESFSGVPMRLDVKELAGALVISDVYNANPASMEGAVGELIRLKKRRAIAVLGDMLELGDFSEPAHRQLVGLLSRSGVDMLIAVGKEMKRASSEFKGTCFLADDSAAAGLMLSEVLSEGDTVLVKGSRGMQMEKALPDGRTQREGEKMNAL